MEGHPTWNNGRTPQARPWVALAAVFSPQDKARGCPVEWGSVRGRCVDGGAGILQACFGEEGQARLGRGEAPIDGLGGARPGNDAGWGGGLPTALAKVPGRWTWPRPGAPLWGKPLWHIPVRRSARRWETPRGGGPFPCGRRLLPVPRTVWARLQQTDGRLPHPALFLVY